MSIYPICAVESSSYSLWTFLLHVSCFHFYPSSDSAPHQWVCPSHHFLNNKQNYYNQDSWSTSPYNEIRIYHIYYQPLCLHQKRRGTFLHFRTSFSWFLKCKKTTLEYEISNHLYTQRLVLQANICLDNTFVVLRSEKWFI